MHIILPTKGWDGVELAQRMNRLWVAIVKVKMNHLYEEKSRSPGDILQRLERLNLYHIANGLGFEPS